MTWRELKDAIDRMPEEQQELDVINWDMCSEFSKVILVVCDEDMYYNEKWTHSVVESFLYDNEKEDNETKLIAKKGTYYLSVQYE